MDTLGVEEKFCVSVYMQAVQYFFNFSVLELCSIMLINF
jgi:hypothetical protein